LLLKKKKSFVIPLGLVLSERGGEIVQLKSHFFSTTRLYLFSVDAMA
jgi:hypothetical protein